MSFRYTGERWVKIMDMAGGTVRIAASHHRGMPDLIVEDGNRLMWDGVKYRDAGYGQVRLAKDDGVATVKL